MQGFLPVGSSYSACASKISLWMKVLSSWIPLPFRIDSQGILPTSVLNISKTACQKSKIAVLLTSPRTKNSIISWSRCSRQLLTTTPATIPSLFVKSRSGGAPPLIDSLISYVRKLTSIHSRNLLNHFVSAVLYFQ